MTPIAEVRRMAEAARDETDERPPRDWDALSPKAARIEEMHGALTPEVVLAVLDRIAELENALERANDRHMAEKARRLDYQERVKDLTA